MECSRMLIIPYGNADTRGMLHSCSKRDFLNYTVQYLERTMVMIRLDSILQLLQAYEANYPEILKYAFVINAPKIFSAAFALIKPFMNENTIRKVKIFGTRGWREVILNEVSPDQLPAHWGGTMTDPDGDPRCPSKIGCGGKIPISYYNNWNDEKVDDSLTTIVLSKAGKKVIDTEVLKPNTELRWKFHSEDYDVAFQVTLDTPSGDQEIIVPYQRVNSHMFPEEGSVLCSTPGTYNILFDNSYSYLRSKKLHYSIELIDPS
ncbi:SEC14-like protein 2 [Armadillidium nasatum]|uniref:SEC14-like protein 2 n=1 Tax=Armadillidium nasatum TaxID=96803 RepID=A0A5N5SWI9_9CRUS|nr:SEC14-like protein 2 [Armadillidium nasatum]